MSRFTLAALVLLCLLMLSSVGFAQSESIVDADKIVLADIVPNVDEGLRGIEIAATPPPGSSRLLNRDEIERVLRRAGVAPDSIALPAAVRVTAAVMRMNEAEVAAWAKSAVEGALPPGATLTQLTAARPLVTSPSATLSRVRLPRFPRRAGEFRSTVVAEIGRDGVVLQRFTLSFVAQLNEEVSRPDVERGSQISLVIETAGATMTAAAVAMESGFIGEVRMFRVMRTGKVLRARIESQHRARVVAQ